MDPTATLTAAAWALVLRAVLHVPVADEAADALVRAARAHDVPVERLSAVCFVESTLGEGHHTGLLCGYQGRITARDRASWAETYGGELTRANARWQATHAARALRRWYDTVCVRGRPARRWAGAAAFYAEGRTCAPTPYALRVSVVAARLRRAITTAIATAPAAIGHAPCTR